MPLVDAEGRTGFGSLDDLSRRDISRIGRYGRLVQDLKEGTISPEAFEGRVSRWRPVAGQRFVSDPDTVLALEERRRADGLEAFLMESG